MAAITEVVLIGGVRYQVEGAASEVEGAILNAARGSIMEFAWLIDVQTGERVGVNPAQVVSLRAIRS